MNFEQMENDENVESCKKRFFDMVNRGGLCNPSDAIFMATLHAQEASKNEKRGRRRKKRQECHHNRKNSRVFAKHKMEVLLRIRSLGSKLWSDQRDVCVIHTVCARARVCVAGSL